MAITYLKQRTACPDGEGGSLLLPELSRQEGQHIEQGGDEDDGGSGAGIAIVGGNEPQDAAEESDKHRKDRVLPAVGGQIAASGGG